MFGIDAVKENIDIAIRLHPEITDRLSVTDLRRELPFPASYFDFVMCNAVIQHIQARDSKEGHIARAMQGAETGWGFTANV